MTSAERQNNQLKKGAEMLKSNIILVSFESDRILTDLERESLIDAISAQVEDPHTRNADKGSLNVFSKSTYTTSGHEIKYFGGGK